MGFVVAPKLIISARHGFTGIPLGSSVQADHAWYRRADSTVAYVDPLFDIAMLRTRTDQPEVLPLIDSDILCLGDDVCMFASPRITPGSVFNGGYSGLAIHFHVGEEKLSGHCFWI